MRATSSIFRKMRQGQGHGRGHCLAHGNAGGFERPCRDCHVPVGSISVHQFPHPVVETWTDQCGPSGCTTDAKRVGALARGRLDRSGVSMAFPIAEIALLSVLALDSLILSHLPKLRRSLT